MKHILRIVIWSEWLILPASAYGADFPELLQRLDQHPALEAARQQALADEAGAKGAAPLPDPMVMLGINNYPADGSGGFDRFAMTNKTLGFEQVIPTPGVRRHTRESQQKLAAKAALAVELTRQRLQAALVDALAARRRIAAQRQILLKERKLLVQEGAYWDGQLEGGATALDERAEVDAESAELEAKLAALEAADAEAKANLESLVGTPETVAVPLAQALPLPAPGQLDGVFPVQLAAQDVAAARADVAVARAAYWPSYKIGMTYSQRSNSGSFDGGDWVSAKVGVSVPLWAAGSQSPRLEAAKARLAAAKSRLADARRTWLHTLTALRARITQAQTTEQALAAKLKAMKARSEALMNAYTSGGSLSQSLTVERRALMVSYQLAQVRSDKISLVADYNSYFNSVSEK